MFLGGSPLLRCRSLRAKSVDLTCDECLFFFFPSHYVHSRFLFSVSTYTFQYIVNHAIYYAVYLRCRIVHPLVNNILSIIKCLYWVVVFSVLILRSYTSHAAGIYRWCSMFLFWDGSTLCTAWFARPGCFSFPFPFFPCGSKPRAPRSVLLCDEQHPRAVNVYLRQLAKGKSGRKIKLAVDIVV